MIIADDKQPWRPSEGLRRADRGWQMVWWRLSLSVAIAVALGVLFVITPRIEAAIAGFLASFCFTLVLKPWRRRGR